jgi:hypothetical protein
MLGMVVASKSVQQYHFLLSVVPSMATMRATTVERFVRVPGRQVLW